MYTLTKKNSIHITILVKSHNLWSWKNTTILNGYLVRIKKQVIFPFCLSRMKKWLFRIKNNIILLRINFPINTLAYKNEIIDMKTSLDQSTCNVIFDKRKQFFPKFYHPNERSTVIHYLFVVLDEILKKNHQHFFWLDYFFFRLLYVSNMSKDKN